MSIQLSDGNGVAVCIDVETYQFPNSKHYWDSNWLQVKGTVTHPLGDWSFCDPCLTAPELASLARWAANADDEEGQKVCFFTEPCLSFELLAVPFPAIALCLSHEAAKCPWIDQSSPITLLFPLALNPLDGLKRAACELLCRFPIKGAPD